MIQQDTAKLRAGGVITDHPIYVDVDGNHVAADSPKVHAQMYGAGAVVSAEDAKRFGIAAPKAEKSGKGESSGDGGTRDTPIGRVSVDIAESETVKAITARFEALEAVQQQQNDRIAQLERDVEDFMRVETDPASDLNGGEMAADTAGVVGKDAPAPENKSGVPETEETKEQGGAVVAAANTPQAQPERKGKGK